MHIVHCLTHSGQGGGQVAVFTAVKFFSRLHPDVRISVVLPAQGIFVDRFRALGVEVYPFAFDRISTGQFSSVLSFLASLRPTVVHSHGKGAGLYCRIRGANGEWKNVHSYHGYHTPASLLPAKLYSSLEGFLLRRTDAIVAVSPSEGKEIRRRFPFAANRIHIIPNLIDREELVAQGEVPLIPAVANFFSANGLSHIVTMIARYDPVKNYPLALGVIERLLARRKDLAFVLVGVDTKDATYCRLVEQYPGKILGTEEYSPVAPILRRSKILLLTSVKEGGLPLVLQEGCCFGKPAVATNVPGTFDLVSHEVNGLLADQSPASLANAVERLVDDPHLYEKVSNGASDFSTTRSPERLVDQFVDLYTSLESRPHE